MHELTREQAELLGLTRLEGTHPDPSMPEWLSDDLAFSSTEFTLDGLQKSYLAGRLVDLRLDDGVVILLGSGAEWELHDQTDPLGDCTHYPLGEVLMEYSSKNPPLLVVSVSENDPEIGSILTLIQEILKFYHPTKDHA